MLIVIGHVFGLPSDSSDPPVDNNVYLVDNTSNQLTDNSGNYLIYGESED